MVPVRLRNLQHPVLIAFVNLMDSICSPQAAREPLEIHFVTSDLAGVCVGIESWREFYHFYVERDPIHGTTIAKTIYVVPVVEVTVIDGVGNHSLDFPAFSPGWTFYRNKYVQKHNLGDLLRRNALVRSIATINQVFNVNLAVAHPPGSAVADNYIKDMKHSGVWRGNGYDETTTPRASHVAARNVRRNVAFH